MHGTNKPHIDEQLARMRRSAVFAKGGRIHDLLAYLVKNSLDGGGERICQRGIAMDVFGRDEDFDPESDAIVRAEMGRLRRKLTEYYAGDGQEDPIHIELPRGSYQPLIRRDGGADGPSLPKHEIRYCRADDGVSLAYSVVGTGYPLFLLPHWMSHLDHDFKTPLFRHFWEELPKRFTLIRFDLRGFGLSERDVHTFSLDRLVADLECVAQAIGVTRFALLGPSGGGPLGVAYAARYPDKVSHLALLGGFIRGPRMTGDPAAKLHADAMQSCIRAGWGVEHSVFRKVFSAMLIPDGTAEQYRRIDEAQLAAASAETAERYQDMMANFDLTQEAANVTCPTIVFHGVREAVPFAEGQYAAAHIPGARLVPLETANHVLTPDEPAWPVFLTELTSYILANETRD